MDRRFITATDRSTASALLPVVVRLPSFRLHIQFPAPGVYERITFQFLLYTVGFDRPPKRGFMKTQLSFYYHEIECKSIALTTHNIFTPHNCECTLYTKTRILALHTSRKISISEHKILYKILLPCCV